MFFKNKTKYNVTKVYFLATSKDSIDVRGLINQFLHYSEFEVAQFSMNYGEMLDTTSELRQIAKLSLDELESLDIFDARGRSVLAVNKVFSYLGLDFSVFEFTTLTNFDEGLKKEILLFSDLSDTGNVTYGYSRFLRDDYLAVTEDRVKKGLFGGASTSIANEETKWLVQPKDIDNGAIKGFYPLNYLSDKAFSVAQQHVNNLFDSQQRKGSLLVIDRQSQRKLSSNPLLKKYTHFSET